MNDFYAREFWRFVSVQQTVAELDKTAIEFPPMQAPASFNLEAVKAQVDEAIKTQSGQERVGQSVGGPKGRPTFFAC
jgi:hypothetical protein